MSKTKSNKVLLEKLIVPYLLMKFLAFTEHDGLLPYSQELTNGPCRESDESSPKPNILLLHSKCPTYHRY
jgi:hypothetical protein